MFTQFGRDSFQRKLASMVLAFSLAGSVIGIFLPAYYLKLSSGGLTWIIEFLATQFIVLAIVPRISLIRFPRHFEKLMLFGFLMYILYNALLIYVNQPVLDGIVAGLALATFWPSFNTMQLRLSESSNRAETINLISILFMTIGSTLGPVVGGVIISFGGGFESALILSSILYLVSYLAIRKFEFKRVTYSGQIFDDGNSDFVVRRNSKYKYFAIGYLFQGMSEVTWFVYPIYVLAITRSYIGLGIVASATSLFIAIMSVSIGRWADSRRSRFAFIVIGLALNSIYYALLPSVQNEFELIGVSAVVGVASAFASNTFALMGDEFSPRQYPSIMARIEAYISIGRLANLGIMFYFMQRRNYFGYFECCALILSLSIPVYYLLQRRIEREKKMISQFVGRSSSSSMSE